VTSLNFMRWADLDLFCQTFASGDKSEQIRNVLGMPSVFLLRQRRAQPKNGTNMSEAKFLRTKHDR
jgi:hypothetical protein